MDSSQQSLYDFIEMIQNAPVEWVMEKIHPNVPRGRKESNSSYVRKMALYAQATNTYFENEK